MSSTGIIDAAAAALRDALPSAMPDVAVIMGSGWQLAADVLGVARAEISAADLPGFTAPSAVGHSGKIRLIEAGPHQALVFLGRTHLYEGHGAAQVAHAVRTAAAFGIGTVILTNAAGGLRPGLVVGQPVLISDHLNLTATSPLVGAQFIDLTDLYSSRLRRLAKEIEPSLAEGVYAALPGPHFETPAEISMLRGMGADLVGMSTALEAIAARAAGMEVLGLSLVTNLAAGITGQPLNHLEVLEAGQASAQRMGGLLQAMIARI
ncbi:MAG: purine-nucleoside phosphorylase [Geodermatophilaceae bacterium]